MTRREREFMGATSGPSQADFRGTSAYFLDFPKTWIGYRLSAIAQHILSTLPIPIHAGEIWPNSKAVGDVKYRGPPNRPS